MTNNIEIGTRVRIIAKQHPWHGYTGILIEETPEEMKAMNPPLHWLVALDTLPPTIMPAVGEHDIEVLEPIRRKSGG